MAKAAFVNRLGQPSPGPLGHMPLVVLSHGHLGAGAVPPGLGPEVAAQYERAWQDMQVEQAGLSTRGCRRVAPQSGHNIQLDPLRGAAVAARHRG